MKWWHINACIWSMALFFYIANSVTKSLHEKQKWECAANGGTIIPRESLSPKPKTDVCLKKEGGR